MSTGKLHRLQDIAVLLREARLAEFQVLDHARRESLARLAALDVAQTTPDLPELAAAEVAIRYQRWADQRRAEINRTLARQTAAWMDARAEAARALGRTEALDRMQEAARQNAARRRT